jgi:hypothetical protein
MNSDPKSQSLPNHSEAAAPNRAGMGQAPSKGAEHGAHKDHDASKGTGRDAAEDSSDPKVHTAHIRQALKDLVAHLRRDIERVAEPKARVLFETSAEVLQGLVKTYDDYDAAKETAFRPS